MSGSNSSISGVSPVLGISGLVWRGTPFPTYYRIDQENSKCIRFLPAKGVPLWNHDEVHDAAGMKALGQQQANHEGCRSGSVVLTKWRVKVIGKLSVIKICEAVFFQESGAPQSAKLC